MVHLLRILPKGLYLSLSIFLFAFILPIFDYGSLKEEVFSSVYSLMLLSIFSIIEDKKKWGYVLIIFDIILIWLMYYMEDEAFKYIAFSLTTVIFIITTITMIIQIIKRKRVDVSLIVETINGYLLIGVIFSFINSMIIWYNPNSIQFSTEILDVDIRDIVYYTYVSMTTIGYGEILPISAVARSMSILSSVIGQLYLAIIMAFIIGKFLNKE